MHNLNISLFENDITELYILRDRDILKPLEAYHYIEKLNELFTGKRIEVAFFHNNPPTSPVEEKNYKIIS